MDHKYVVAVDYLRGNSLYAAAVVYPESTPEPSFTYKAGARTIVSHLYRRGDRIPPAIDPALSNYVRSNALSWSVVCAHQNADVSKALALAIVRSLELWYCRTNALPQLSETRVELPLKKRLSDLPESMTQITSSKDWRVFAARALCRHKNAVYQSEKI